MSYPEPDKEELVKRLEEYCTDTELSSARGKKIKVDEDGTVTLWATESMSSSYIKRKRFLNDLYGSTINITECGYVIWMANMHKDFDDDVDGYSEYEEHFFVILKPLDLIIWEQCWDTIEHVDIRHSRVHRSGVPSFQG